MKAPRAAVALNPDAMLSDRNVNMSNALTRASHGLGLAEKRLIASCIAKNDSMPMAEIHRKGAWTVRLSAAEYAETFEIGLDSAYEQLQQAADSLFNRYVRTVQETPKGPKEIKFRWVGKAEYHKGEGWVELHWWHEVVPHLFGLRQQFTSYKLKQTAALRSAYSWRLYECFKSWAGKGRYTPSIEEFHRAMDAKESHRANFKELRRRVIEPAVTELIEKNGLLIEWTTVNAGRKVVGLDFKFSANPQTSLF
ncbi:gp37 [Burkholderia phage KS14]|uniref:Gp37 n=2 Tax=Kisquattuordecimvirus TaxID=2732982 RepID=E5FFJ0_9CAUD|nr:replication initiation protein [Burkholderia phage KS14]ADP02382.1 gp37 [Burkholderia phage KS14]